MQSMQSLIDVTSSAILPAGTDSADILAALSNRYGAVKYTQQSVQRYPYYYYAQYPAAGAGSIGFWGTNQAQSTGAITNIEQAGTLGNYSMLITSISYDVMLYIPTVANNAPWAYTTEALAPYADIVHGLTQGGYATFKVNNTEWDQVPLPFMFSPGGIGKNRMELSQGAFAWSQAGVSPFAVTGSQTALCYADIERRAWRRRNLTNPIFLAPQQTFQHTLTYDFGLIPVISTSVINNTTAFIYVGAILDGYRFAPVS